MTTLIPKFEQTGTGINRPISEKLAQLPNQGDFASFTAMETYAETLTSPSDMAVQPQTTVRTLTSKLQEIVSVKDFGATGDGTTDDALAIIAALDSFGTNGGILYFPIGTYIVGQAIPIRQGIHYLGESPLSSVLKASASSPDNILGYGYPTTAQSVIQNNFIVENLTFDGNKANRTENQLALKGAASGGSFDAEHPVTSSSGGTAICAARTFANDSVTLDPTTIVGTFNVGDTVTDTVSGATMVVASKAADDAYQINIRVQSGSLFRITGCKIINSFFTALSIYNNCVEATIDNNVLSDNNKAGTVLLSPYDIYVESYARDITIFNNLIISGLGNAITVRGGIVSGMRIISNKISNSGNYGLELQSAGFPFTDTSVVGNRFYAAPNSSADQLTVIGGASPATMEGVSIVGNNFDTGGQAIGIRSNVDGFSIVGNTFKDITTTLYSISASGTGTPINYQVFGNASNTLPAQANNVNLNGSVWYTGTGTPEANVYANIGSFFLRTDGSAGTTFYVKEANNGSPFGWVGK